MFVLDKKIWGLHDLYSRNTVDCITTHIRKRLYSIISRIVKENTGYPGKFEFQVNRFV